MIKSAPKLVAPTAATSINPSVVVTNNITQSKSKPVNISKVFIQTPDIAKKPLVYEPSPINRFVSTTISLFSSKSKSTSPSESVISRKSTIAPKSVKTTPVSSKSSPTKPLISDTKKLTVNPPSPIEQFVSTTTSLFSSKKVATNQSIEIKSTVSTPKSVIKVQTSKITTKLNTTINKPNVSEPSPFNRFVSTTTALFSSSSTTSLKGNITNTSITSKTPLKSNPTNFINSNSKDSLKKQTTATTSTVSIKSIDVNSANKSVTTKSVSSPTLKSWFTYSKGNTGNLTNIKKPSNSTKVEKK